MSRIKRPCENYEEVCFFRQLYWDEMDWIRQKLDVLEMIKKDQKLSKKEEGVVERQIKDLNEHYNWLSRAEIEAKETIWEHEAYLRAEKRAKTPREQWGEDVYTSSEGEESEGEDD